MQRSLGGPELVEPPLVKPQPSPSMVSRPSVSEQKVIPTPAQKEKPIDAPVAKKDINEATLGKTEAKAESAISAGSQKTELPPVSEKTQVPSGTEQAKVQGVSGQQQPPGKSPQVQPAQTTKPKVMASVSKQGEAEKPPQQPPKSPTPTAKSAPPSKQESGSFFGFGGPKSQPVKSAESVTGKMFGFGSSIFSSASTLITSAVQDEPKTTPPTPRKMSIPAQDSAKAKSPVSPKMSPSKGSKPIEQKSKPTQQAKADALTKAKEEKPPSDSSKAVPKEKLSTCPLCKVELNMGSKDPPNYNTCTECKSMVCNLCGFNPMPHTGAVRSMAHFFLCLSMNYPSAAFFTMFTNFVKKYGCFQFKPTLYNDLFK